MENVLHRPVGTIGAKCKTQLKLNKEILYKSATPMKMNIASRPGSKEKDNVRKK
jgi:hypothetical protein